jgi:uncharacterized protein (TIGR03000 family)
MRRQSSFCVLAALGLSCMPGFAGQQTESKPAKLRLLVPAAAKVSIDDYATASTGEVRLYETPPLLAGKTFTYQIKATWDEGSVRIVRMAAAKVEAGKETVVDLRHGSKDGSSSQIIFLPTPDVVVAKMMELAMVTKDDVVFDLGCGDGRMVIAAAKKYGAHGVGIDLDPQRVKEARANVDQEKVDQLVEIRHGDALKVADLDRATVIVLYMLPEFMDKLKPVVQMQCKPGTRIVAHDYPFPGWEPQRKLTMPSKRRPMQHTLYLWVVGEK